jgi:tetratricopeptide (TPR) repeat protein
MMRSMVKGLMLLLMAILLATAQERTTKVNPADLSLTAVGRQHHPIATNNPEAQEYFDQGITLIYAFNHEEAERAFSKAAELDPLSPMPLWGMALAVGPNYNMDVNAAREKLAYETVERAQELAGHAPQIEKDYVTALQTRYSGAANPDYKKLAQDYAAAMKGLSAKYPDDLDAATLYAESLMDLNPWKLWTLDGRPAENTLEIVRVLESVLQRDPLHAGANHYYIHAVEASQHPERALPSAHRLDTLVPTAGHLVHMPSHIYERTGNYDQARESNAQAARVDSAYAEEAAQEGSLYDLMYHSHNEHFLAMAASMEGCYSEAKKAADGMVRRLIPHAKMMPMLDRFMATPIWVDARFGQWEEIQARPEPMKELPGTHAMWRYSRALGYAANGKVAEAEKENNLFVTEVAAFPPDAMYGPLNKAKDVYGIAALAIEARIAAAQGQKEQVIGHWRKAVELQDTLKYMEPADWYYPVRESLGAALLAAGKPAEAEAVFREDLLRNPRNPRSLYGLKEALQAQNRSADSAWVEKQFNAAWKEADTKLSLATL